MRKGQILCGCIKEYTESNYEPLGQIYTYFTWLQCMEFARCWTVYPRKSTHTVLKGLHSICYRERLLDGHYIEYYHHIYTIKPNPDAAVWLSLCSSSSFAIPRSLSISLSLSRSFSTHSTSLYHIIVYNAPSNSTHNVTYEWHKTIIYGYGINYSLS